VSLRFRLPGAPRFLWEWTHSPNRKPVSRPRRVKPSVPVSVTRLSWLFRIKSYETYRAGATFGIGA
jgi:hypothetical protein